MVSFKYVDSFLSEFSDCHVSDFSSVVLVVECVCLQDVLKKAYNL